MSIDAIRYARKDGTQVERFRVRKITLGKRGPTWGTYDTREEAERQNDIANAMADRIASYTLKDFGENYYICDTNPSTKGKWKNHVLTDPIALVELAGITKDDARGWIRRQCATELRTSVIAINAGIFRYAFKAAMAEDKILTNPLASIWSEVTFMLRNRKASEEAKGIKTAGDQLSRGEVNAVLACQDIPEHARLRIVIFALQGWRRGEFVSLKLEDLHLDSVPPFADIKTGGIGKPRKSRKAYRSIILPEALPLLRRWLELTSGKPNDLGLVFPSERGGWQRQPFQISKRVGKRSVGTNMLSAWLALAGIVRPFRIHDLRHTGGSLMAATAPLAIVQKHLGHASINSTLRYIGSSDAEYANHLWAPAAPKSMPKE